MFACRPQTPNIEKITAEFRWHLYLKPVPSAHLHFYKFSTDTWISSTSNTSQLNGKTLTRYYSAMYCSVLYCTMTRMGVARMNHACIKFSEGGQTKVMVVGGVTASQAEEFRSAGK